MIFPITELLDEQESIAWVEKHFHPKGLAVPRLRSDTRKRRVSFASTSAALSITAVTTASGPITSIREPSLRGAIWSRAVWCC